MAFLKEITVAEVLLIRNLIATWDELGDRGELVTPAYTQENILAVCELSKKTQACVERMRSRFYSYNAKCGACGDRKMVDFMDDESRKIIATED